MFSLRCLAKFHRVWCFTACGEAAEGTGRAKGGALLPAVPARAAGGEEGEAHQELCSGPV